MDIGEFIEEYTGVKLKPYQKLMLKAMKKKDAMSYYINPRRVYKGNLIEYQIEIAKASKMNFIVYRYDRIEHYENGELVKVEKKLI